MCHRVFIEVTSGNGTTYPIDEKSWVPLNATAQRIRAFCKQRSTDKGLTNILSTLSYTDKEASYTKAFHKVKWKAGYHLSSYVMCMNWMRRSSLQLTLKSLTLKLNEALALIRKRCFLVASLFFCFYYQTIECVYAKKIDPQLEGTDHYVRTTVIKHPFHTRMSKHA